VAQQATVHDRDFTGGREDGSYARRENLGFETRAAVERLRSRRSILRASNPKDLAYRLPTSL
jgi:hypothetical protein